MKQFRKTKKANHLAVLFLMLIILATSLVPTQTAHAASIKFDKKVYLTLYRTKQKVDTSEFCYIQNLPSGKTISKVKSSKKKVVAAKQTSTNEIKLTPKKPGTAKVTFQYAKKKYTITATAAYWKNPCKSFKIGDTEYSSNFKISGRYCVNRKTEDLSAQVSIVPNKGWKLVDITNDGHKVKNNSTVLLRPSYIYGGFIASGSHVRATFQNKKTKQVVYLVLEYSDEDKPNENQFWVTR